MIHIKKLTIITLIIIIGLFSTILLLKQPKKPAEKIEKVIQQEQISESPEESEEEQEVISVKEDPVREFLSEKLEKAVDFFFTQEINVVTLGDSLTEGVGDETKNNGYVGVLDKTINKEREIVHFENYAKRGSRSGQLLTRLEDEEVVESIENADIIIITIGANDVMQVFKENFTDLTLDKFTSEQIRYEQRLMTIFSEIKDMNEYSNIYLIGFYNPFNEYFADIEELEFIVDSWNQIGLDVTEQFDDISYIPIKDLFEDTQINYLSEDNFHPNHLGYRLIAERILQYVTNEGELDDQTEGTVE